MDSLTSASVRQLALRIRAREVSALEVFEAHVARVEALNPMLNAIISFDAAAGRAEALRADERIAAGDKASLLGVPYTVKDNIWVKGRVISQGSALFSDFVAPRDALCVQRMRDAGAVLLGITNCSEFACKGITTNRVHGTTRNPWNVALTPGGSSGGAASAVAAGLCPAAITTDGGGSTRRPAALVGAVGMKPSAGLIAHPYGFEEPVIGNSVIGQIARTTGDVAALLDVLAGGDRSDPASIGMPRQDSYLRQLRDVPRGLRVGFSQRLGLGFPVDHDVAQSVRFAVMRVEALGIQVDEVDQIGRASCRERV